MDQRIIVYMTYFAVAFGLFAVRLSVDLTFFVRLLYVFSEKHR